MTASMSVDRRRPARFVRARHGDGDRPSVYRRRRGPARAPASPAKRSCQPGRCRAVTITRALAWFPAYSPGTGASRAGNGCSVRPATWQSGLPMRLQEKACEAGTAKSTYFLWILPETTAGRPPPVARPPPAHGQGSPLICAGRRLGARRGLFLW